jgi:hypothetical protein
VDEATRGVAVNRIAVDVVVYILDTNIKTEAVGRHIVDIGYWAVNMCSLTVVASIITVENAWCSGGCHVIATSIIRRISVACGSSSGYKSIRFGSNNRPWCRCRYRYRYNCGCCGRFPDNRIMTKFQCCVVGSCNSVLTLEGA